MKNLFAKIKDFVRNLIQKIRTFLKNVKWKIVWDKVTTGLLILLFITPLAVLTYILLWFVYR